MISPRSLGEKRYWPDAVRKRHVFPAAEKGRDHKADRLAQLPPNTGYSVAVFGRIGKDDADASPEITMSVYAKAVTADKRQAQDSITALFVGNSNQSATT
jgi:integrase